MSSSMTPFNLDVPNSAVGGVITIGNFDGVHRGHQKMLTQVCEIAAQQQLRAVVLTFDPHPITVLKPEIRLPRLTDVDARIQLLKNYGADDVIVLPVSPILLNMLPEEFFSDVIQQRLQAKAVVEGPDFRFGKDRAGDTKVLKSLCSDADIDVTIINAVEDDDEMISSTRIRQLLQEGDIAGATDLLGHSYVMSGTVVKGAERGRTLGFPTANLDNISVLIPADGVYAGSCQLGEKAYPVAMNIGPNPTFEEDARKVECHLIGFDGDLYGKSLDIVVSERLRAPRSFDSAEELRQQIEQDVAAAASR